MKTQSNNLAILGGKPEFDKIYHLVKPLFPSVDDMVKGLKTLYKTRYLSNQGYHVQTLEKKLAEFLNVDNCALFCNGTIAEMCLFKCLNIKGSVLVPSFTFPATIQALHWIGLKTKFVEIDKKTLLMDPKKVEQLMSNDIGAILPVNLYGACCDHDELKSIAKKYNVPLIYDSAQAFGTKYKGKNVGSLGDAEIFSFHATKVLHTGEGGAVVTNNRDLYKKLCKIRNFGFNQYLNFAELGINGKMNEVSALVGLILLDKFDYYLSKREKIYDYYIKSISDIKGIIPLDTREIPHVTPNYSYFYVLIKPDIYGLTNLELYYVLIEENIISRCYFYPPVHRSEYYLKLSGSQNVKLPVTDKAALNTLALPFNSEMSFKEIDKIISAIKKCQLHSMEIKKAVSFKVPRTWQDLYKDDLEDPYDSVLTLKKS